MFGIKHNEFVGFESRWKVTKVYSEESTQTDQSTQVDNGTNSTVSTDQEVQVEDTCHLKDVASVDDNKLAEWLKNIYPLLKRELDEANNSNAFKGYKCFENNEEPYCKLLQTVDIDTKKDKFANLYLMCWNASGKTLAVSCGFEHKNWCYHAGHVKIFSLTRDEKISEKPSVALTTDGCLTSLTFHPKYNSLLAASTYIGGVIIWNLQNEDEKVIFKLTAHDQSINQMIWINDADLAKSILLATCSNDGLLKLWNFNLTGPSLNLKTRYKIKPPIFGGYPESGIVCFDFSKHVPGMFVVCLEGGLIAQCSSLGAIELKGHTNENPLLDPVFKYSEPHGGEITSVSFSPSRSEIFMTCGTDLEIRVYVIGQEEPAQVIFLKKPLHNLLFVPYEENIIVGGNEDEFIKIFHLISGKSVLNITKEKVERNSSTSIAINPWRTNKIAVGKREGKVELWYAPWRSFARQN